jgi:Phospholipase C
LKKKWIAGLAAAMIILVSAAYYYLSHFQRPAAAPQPDAKTKFIKPAQSVTTTPIKHLVVLFDENISFDHYFGTYPNAVNAPGEPRFTAKPGTPVVNGLTPPLLTHNPNASNPQRLSRRQAMTPDMNHAYTAEQKAYHQGKMDQFVPNTGKGNPLVMDYYDGNTVTALWHYAQNFAMSDNSFNTTFGPSTPGALNLISGQTHGVTAYQYGRKVQNIAGSLASGTLFGDLDPYYDKASGTSVKITASGKNVGDLLNAKGVTWGWFEGGFRNPEVNHQNKGGKAIGDYSPHHEPFQYYPSTANPNHLAPSSVSRIGYTDRANHQYDLTDFWAAADGGSLPAVSYLKPPAYQDGHAGYSDPLDEQNFIVDTLNRLQRLPQWKDTAVIIAYDDSDGWYDHAAGPIVNGSADPKNDVLSAGKAPQLGNDLDRAGYGPRLPLLVLSPYAKTNFVDHTLTDQTSILRFIEDNWQLGRIGNHSYDVVAGSIDRMFDFQRKLNLKKLILNPTTGEAVR